MTRRPLRSTLFPYTTLFRSYVVRTVTATLTHFDLALEEAAQSLGAHPIRAFLEVTLGVIKPGVVAGAIFAFAISFDNFTLSLFLTSSRLTPLPIRSEEHTSELQSPMYL